MAKARKTSARTSPSADAFPFASARAALLDWFKAHGRALPWRVDPTPYRVWVSEIMLQQTTTQTVERYFDRFLARFPVLKSVADADEEELLKYWEGLGYYRRAKSMRAAAIQLVQARLVDLPDDYDALARLPGVGRYVAGAVLSFGFDRRAAILEANTTRLHARLLALRESTDAASAQAALWRFALDWLPETASAPGTYRALNSALMDLGRTVCAPKSPACLACPLRDVCRAAALNLQDALPVKKERIAPIPRRDVAFWIPRADLRLRVESEDARLASPDAVLLVKRAKGALWSGLWDFPRFEDVDRANLASPLAEALRRFLVDDVQAAPSVVYAPGETVAVLKHSVTKYRVTLELKRLAASPASTKSRKAKTSDVASPACEASKFEAIRWVSVEELQNYPLSSTGRKLAAFVASQREGIG